MLNRILLTVTIIAVVIVSAGVWKMLDQPVQRFVIRGNLTSAEQALLADRLKQQEIGGVLSVDLQDVVAVIRQVDWARGVEVRRRWPDHLEITLTKERPVARWSGDRYVGISGELLQMPDQYPGLPQFMVELSEPRKAMEVYRLISQVTTRASLQIRLLEENAQGEWVVHFNNGLALALGSERLSDRTQRFLTVYRRVLANHDQSAVYADARYTNGVAVRFSEELDVDQTEALASVK